MNGLIITSQAKNAEAVERAVIECSHVPYADPSGWLWQLCEHIAIEQDMDASAPVRVVATFKSDSRSEVLIDIHSTAVKMFQRKAILDGVKEILDNSSFT